jgi:hypothetical protein
LKGDVFEFLYDLDICRIIAVNTPGKDKLIPLKPVVPLYGILVIFDTKQRSTHQITKYSIAHACPIYIYSFSFGHIKRISQHQESNSDFTYIADIQTGDIGYLKPK